MTNFYFQMLIWGYAVDGRPELSSFVAEERWDIKYTSEYHISTWDCGSTYLDTVQVNGERAPDKFACYWVCEHQRRHSPVP